MLSLTPQRHGTGPRSRTSFVLSTPVLLTGWPPRPDPAGGSSTGTRTRFWRLRASCHIHRPSSLAAQTGLEPASSWSTARCSSHWSYYAEEGRESLAVPGQGGRGRTCGFRVPNSARCRCATPWLDPEPGVEPDPAVYKAAALPLSYSGKAGDRGVEPRPAGFGGPPEPCSSPVVWRDGVEPSPAGHESVASPLGFLQWGDQTDFHRYLRVHTPALFS